MRRRLVLLCALLAGCTDPEPPACAGVPLAQSLLVLEVDHGFTASALGRVERDGCMNEVADSGFGQDPVLADAHGRPLVIARDRGEIHEVDRDELRVVRRVATMRPGQPSGNPWGADFDEQGQLWVARYDVPLLGIVAPDGSWQGEVDLAEHDDDANPEMAIVEVVGDTVFVMLQRLLLGEDGYTYPAKGLVVAYHALPPHELRTKFELHGRNPFTATRVPGAESLLAVATPGDFFALDESDGAELVDLAAGSSRQLLSETSLGGSVNQIVIAGPGEGYAIVAAPEEPNATWVVAFDPEAGEVTGVLVDSRTSEPGYRHWGLAVAGDHVFVGDRAKGASRIVVLDRASGAEVTSIAPRVMPPVALLPVDP